MTAHLCFVQNGQTIVDGLYAGSNTLSHGAHQLLLLSHGDGYVRSKLSVAADNS